MNRGFLGTAAPLASDLTLIIEITMGLALIVGMLLARKRRYRAHAWCQSTVVLLNLVPITLTMASSFRRSFAPPLPGLHNWYYGLAAVHAGLGALTELLGLYILTVAGTALVPRHLRFTRYKAWMRTTLAMWWLALLLGLATYFRWYVAPLLQ